MSITKCVTNMGEWLTARSPLVVLGVLLLALTGCGGQADKNPVSGTVTFKSGEPLPAGRVIFESTAGPNGFTAELTEAGTFDVDLTYAEVKAGDYAVSIAGALSKGIINRDPVTGKPEVIEPQVPLIDAKYTQRSTSPLTAKITEGSNTFHFEVEPPPK